MKPDDGGPAFTATGISERDYFAAKAMQSLLMLSGSQISLYSSLRFSDLAKDSYAVADAMLAVKNEY